jgi:hypothetical protein
MPRKKLEKMIWIPEEKRMIPGIARRMEMEGLRVPN